MRYRDRDYGDHRREHRGGMDPSVPTPVVVLRNLHPDTAQDKVCFFIPSPLTAFDDSSVE